MSSLTALLRRITGIASRQQRASNRTTPLLPSLDLQQDIIVTNTPPPASKVAFRVCTRGDNPRLVRHICARNIALLQSCGSAMELDWCIEIVTDRPLDLAEGLCASAGLPLTQVVEIIVPSDYQPPNGSAFKARALHYANATNANSATAPYERPSVPSSARSHESSGSISNGSKWYPGRSLVQQPRSSPLPTDDLNGMMEMQLHMNGALSYRSDPQSNSMNPLSHTNGTTSSVHSGAGKHVSTIGPYDYIVHLDEETILKPSCVAGVVELVKRNAARSDARVGQGIILYGHEEIVNPLTTMADSIRVSDDYCRFRMYHTIGYPIQGMKGSYVVCRSDVECDVSFDVGAPHSITEDAAFALKAMQKGVKFDFCRGVMLEKSPFTFVDFIKQRRRWMQGLWLNTLQNDIRWNAKIVLFVMMLTWTALPFIVLFNYLLLFIPAPPHTPYEIFNRTTCQAVTLFVYLFGAIHNFNIPKWGLLYVARYIVFVSGTVLLIPVWNLLEACGVIYVLLTFRARRDFYVVKKEHPALQRTSANDIPSHTSSAEEPEPEHFDRHPDGGTRSPESSTNSGSSSAPASMAAVLHGG